MAKREEFDDTMARLDTAGSAHGALNLLEEETGGTVPEEMRTHFVSVVEEAVAIVSKEAFEAGTIARSDPERALEMLGGEATARARLNPADFEELMELVRKKREEGEQ